MERRINEKGLELEEEGMVKRTQRDSKEEKVGVEIIDAFMEERWMMARPPPLPVSLGELMMEKLCGQRL